MRRVAIKPFKLGFTKISCESFNYGKFRDTSIVLKAMVNHRLLGVSYANRIVLLPTFFIKYCQKATI